MEQPTHLAPHAGVRMQASEFLDLWLSVYANKYPLTAHDRAKFLKRAEVSRILQYPDHEIVACTRRARKLTDILDALSSIEVEVPSPRNAPTKSEPTSAAPKRSRTSEQKADTGGARESTTRSGRSRQAGSVWQPPVRPDEAKKATVDFDKQDRHYP